MERVFKCHHCDYNAESKYARKQHEKICRAVPRQIISSRYVDDRVVTAYVPYWDRQRHLSAKARHGREQGFVEPFRPTSYREILLNGERD